MRLSDIIAGNWQDETPGGVSVPCYGLIYARVSTDMQERAGLSIPAQVKEIERYAAQHGITVLETYQEAHSAFIGENRRPVFERMIQRAKTERQISVILVHDFSRFSRDSVKGKSLFRELQDEGIRVVSATDADFDSNTAAGIWMEAVTFAKNEAYSREIAFHTRKGMKENITRRDDETGWCYKNGGAAPWGYVIERVQRGVDLRHLPTMKALWQKDETVIAGRAVWEWARHILVDLRLERHTSLDGIRDVLNTNGIPSSRRVFWGASSIRALLQPHVLLQFAGYGVWNVHKRKGGNYFNPQSEWIIVENAHPAIITLEEAEGIMAVNEDQARKWTDHSHERAAARAAPASRFLLTGGLLTCGHCGANMTSYLNQGRDYYVCGAKRYRKGLGCIGGPHTQLPKEEIESAIVTEIQTIMQAWCDPASIRRMMQEDAQAATVTSDLTTQQATKDLVDVEKQIDSLRKNLLRGLDTEEWEWCQQQLRELKEKRDELQAACKPVDAPAPAGLPTPREMEVLLGYMREAMESNSNTDKRALIRGFVQNMGYNPDTRRLSVAFYTVPLAIILPKQNAYPVSSRRSCKQVGSGGRI